MYAHANDARRNMVGVPFKWGGLAEYHVTPSMWSGHWNALNIYFYTARNIIQYRKVFFLRVKAYGNEFFYSIIKKCTREKNGWIHEAWFQLHGGMEMFVTSLFFKKFKVCKTRDNIHTSLLSILHPG